MSDLKRGSFAEVMEGLEDSLEDVPIEAEEASEEQQGDEAEANPSVNTIIDNERDEAARKEQDGEDEEEEEEGSEEESEEEEGEDVGDGEEEDSEEDSESDSDDDEPLTFTVKIDGKEQEVDEEELIRGYQTAKSSTKRFSEAKRMQEEAQTFWQQFTAEDKNPGNALVSYVAKQNGGDRIKARQQVVQKFLEFMAPEIQEQQIEDERERKLYRQQLEIEEKQRALEEQENEVKTKSQLAAEEEFISDLRVNIDTQIKRLKLPNKDEIWQKAGEILDAAKGSGYSNAELLDLVPTVMKRIKEDRVELANRDRSTLTDEEFEELYADRLKAWEARAKKKRIDKVKKKKSKAPEEVKEESKPKAKKRARPKAMNSLDVFNSIDLSKLVD